MNSVKLMKKIAKEQRPNRNNSKNKKKIKKRFEGKPYLQNQMKMTHKLSLFYLDYLMETERSEDLIRLIKLTYFSIFKQPDYHKVVYDFIETSDIPYEEND